MVSRGFLASLALGLSLAGGATQLSAQTKLLRFPDIYRDTVVFVYGGDLWKAPAGGGTAVRLTAHPGLELFPKFSPDGKWIAFTGQYDGDEQVYIIPASGGEPRQLTFYPAHGPLPPRWGYDNQVYGFTPDGKRVLFRSLRDTWDISDSRLYTVSVDGGPAEVLPMPTAGAGDFSGDGHQLVYSPLSRDFRTWKRYQGGWAQDLWLFDLDAKTATQLTHHPRTDRDPMWIAGKLYFVSDRDGKLNLYTQPLSAAEPTQLTFEKQWDVRWASADPAAGKIVYELGGELQVFDIASGKAQPAPILVPDDGLSRRPSRVSAEGDIENGGLSPKAERALFAARGDIFTAPIEKGPVRNLTHSSNAHDRLPSWSPDGSKIAFVSDRTGEEEIYLINQDGSGTPEALTTTFKARLYRLAWAPDGKRIAFADKNGKVYVLTVADKKVVEVADDPRGLINDYTWSPKGNFLAFTLSDARGYGSIQIWSAADGQRRQASQGFFNEFNPAWDPEGKYLYFLSQRSFVPLVDQVEWNYANDRQVQIYALALQKDGPNPFPPQSDEVTVETAKPSADASADKAADKGKEGGKKADAKKGDEKGETKTAEAELKVDFDGLQNRVTLVPVPAENYFGLSAVKGHLIYAKFSGFYYGREGVGQPSVEVFSFEKRQAKTLASGVQNGELSADGSKILLQLDGGWFLFDAKLDGEGSKKPVATDKLYVDRVPAEEWSTILDEVWRRFRDYFYVQNMHGYDWEAIHQQYRSLLPYVTHRADLNYLMGEMIAELNVSHSYVTGGDFLHTKRSPVALFGGRLSLDPASGRYRLSHVFRGDNAEDSYRSPLTEVGVDLAEGSYILAVDGVELTAKEDPYRQLRNKLDRPVELTVNDKPSFEGSRKVSFKPIADEQPLVYLEWVKRNYDHVQQATGGRVGYLHIPDMGSDGIREFTKWYYPQIAREGLVVDVRGNGGGNVSSMIINRLSKKLLGTDFGRLDDYASTYPQSVFNGYLACLISQTSASDGDIFPYMFRQAGLGPLIGKRTWGGVVGITDHGPLLDGGGVSVPQFASASPDGKYVIEGHGVDPDIEVENLPQDLLAGKDAQLDRGIAEVMKKIQAAPKKLPSRPADPVRRQDRYDAVPFP